MSYLDLLPSDLVGLFDVYLHHGCKLTLQPFIVSIFQDGKWLKIINEDISEDIVYNFASNYHIKDSHIRSCTMRTYKGSTSRINTGSVVYTPFPNKLAKTSGYYSWISITIIPGGRY